MAYGDDDSQLRGVFEGSPLGDAPGNINQIYWYRTNDADTVVEGDGYFDGVLNDGLNVGDLIFAEVDVDGTEELKLYRVTVGGADVTVVVMPLSAS